MNSCGEITPCDFTPLRFGNVREESLAAIWQRLIGTSAYCARSTHCRMQDAEFRRRWIDPIPSCGPFPYPADRLGTEAGKELPAAGVRPLARLSP